MSLQDFIGRFATWLPWFLLLVSITGEAWSTFRSSRGENLRLPEKHAGSSRGRSLVKLLLPAAAAAAVMVPLLQVWLNAVSDGYSAYGMLPWSDAGHYYRGAEQLLETGRLDDWNCRRPLATALLAVNLAVTGHYLPAVQAMQAVLLALSIYALAHSVGEDLGWPCGLMVFGILYAYVDSVKFIHWLSSEWVGMTVGALAAALLWIGSRDGRNALVLWGTAVLTMALNARSGAFLVLPALVLWAGMAFRENRLFRWNMVALCVVGILFAFLLNASIMKIYGNRFGPGHGNFSLTLYGLASGNPGWTQLYRDFPESRDLPESALNEFAYRKSIDHLRRNPSRFARSLAMSGKDFLSQYFFPFESWKLVGRKWAILRTLSIFFAACALAFFLRNRRRREYSMLAASFAGIVVSVLFLWFDGETRIYAATFPLLAVFLSSGMLLWGRADALPPANLPARWRPRRGSFLFAASAVLVAAGVAGPAVAHRLEGKARMFSALDSPGRGSVVIRSDAPRITLLRSDSPERTFVPRIRSFEQYRELPSFAEEDFKRIPLPGVVFYAKDLLVPESAVLTDKYVWVLGPEGMGQEKRRYLLLRGEYRKETNIFRVSEFSAIENVQD